MPSVARTQRFTRQNPCPVCSGWDNLPRGHGKRCGGFMSDNGDFCNCTREEYAHGLPLKESSGTYGHYMHGLCDCGTQHGPAKPSIFDFSGNHNTSKNKTESDWSNKPPIQKPEIVALYDYVSKEGEIVYQAIRYEPKNFKQRRPDGNGGWHWNLDGVKLVPYHLPQLLRSDLKTPVHIVEGEKDVHTLESLGLIATCNPMGAKKWRKEFNDYLTGRDIVIHQDNDKDGEAHTKLLLENLYPVARTIRIITYEDLPEKSDVSDWISQGHSLEELHARIAQATNTGKPAPEYFPLLSFAELANLPKPSWLIEPILVRGYLTCVYGPTQTAKSFLMLDLALRVAAAGFKVIYVIAESANGYYARAHAWYQYHEQIPNDNIRFIPMPVQLLLPEQVYRLECTIDDHYKDEPPAFIIFDTLSKCYVGGDENDAKDMRLFVSACDNLRRKYNATVGVVHHAPKVGGSPRGSSVITGDFDTIIETAKKVDNDQKLITVKCEKQKDAREFGTKIYRLQTTGELFDFDDSCVLVEEDTSGPTDPKYQDKLPELGITILETLNQSALESEGLTSSKMMSILEIDPKTQKSAKSIFYQILSRLVDLRLVEKVITGKSPVFKITISGKDYLEPQPL